VVADLVLIALGIALQPFRLSAFILILSTAIMQPWTLVAAAAVTAAAARLSSVGDYLALALFCLLATSSFIVLELYVVCAPAASTQLAALRNWLDMHGNEVIIIVCLVLGVWLTGQSIRLLAIEAGR
jgi:hypothetical protein